MSWEKPTCVRVASVPRTAERGDFCRLVCPVRKVYVEVQISTRSQVLFRRTQLRRTGRYVLSTCAILDEGGGGGALVVNWGREARGGRWVGRTDGSFLPARPSLANVFPVSDGVSSHMH